MADVATLTIWLRKAEEAYNNLQTGKLVKVMVDQNGERVEFNTTTAPRLLNYILDLKRQLGMNVKPLGPMRHFL